MKACHYSLISLALLITASLGGPTGWALGQSFTTLHSFTGESDGGAPCGGLVLVSNRLYGLASAGGSSGNGTVYALNPDGTGFTLLHSFAPGATNAAGAFTNADGALGSGELCASNGLLYGTTSAGGTAGSGTAFGVKTDGSAFAVLHHFAAVDTNSLGLGTNRDGACPRAGLLLANGTLYGTASEGGAMGYGTIYALNLDGSGFTNLYSFTGGQDGAYPRGPLQMTYNMIRGTTVGVGPGAPAGMVFVFYTNSGFGSFPLYRFAVEHTNEFGVLTNADGAGLLSGLVPDERDLYLLGAAARGGQAGSGTLFAARNDASWCNIVHSFSATEPPGNPAGTNYDGAQPSGRLVLSGSTLYGTAAGGGNVGNGTIFCADLYDKGGGFKTLYHFTETPAPALTNSDGAHPRAGLLLAGNTFYGTASAGGSAGLGTVFKLSVPPPGLTLRRAGTNVVVAWPYYAPAVSLQTTTNPALPAKWGQVMAPPYLLNGECLFTNRFGDKQRFFRLAQ